MSDVREFGAVGDGQQDDTQAIQHAIKEGDGAILFSPGVYRITKPVEVDLDSRTFTGLSGSAGAAKLVMAGPGPALRLVGTHAGTGDPASVKPSIFARQRMPRVSDLEIEGAHELADGLELIGTMQAIVSGVLIHDVRNAIRLHRRNRNVIITNCHLYHNRGVGLFLDEVNLHQINVTCCHISYNRLGGIRVSDSEIRNLQITGNDIEYNNHKSHGSDPEPTAEIIIDSTATGASVLEVTVASNTIQSTPSAGGANIRILDNAEQGLAPGLFSITGNVIGNQETNIHLVGCHDVVINGNHIYSCTNRNLLIEKSRQVNIGGNNFRRHTNNMFTGVRLVESTDCILHGCSIRDEDPVGQPTDASLLEVIYCQRITIANCQLLDGAPYCLHVVESSSVNVNGCTLADTRATPLAKAVVRWEGAGKRNLMSGNLLDSRAGATDISDTANVELTANGTDVGSQE